MMDWLSPLQAFGAVLLLSAKFLLRACYLVTIPLHYPIYYLFALASFLLTPLWLLVRACLSSVSAVVNLATRLKYLYVYFATAALIGVCAALLLHGTASFIFVLLGIDASSQGRTQQQQRQRKQQERQLATGSRAEHDDRPPDVEEADYDDGYYDFEEPDSYSASGASSSMSSSASGRRKGSASAGPYKKLGGAETGFSTPDPTHEMFENKWKLLRPAERPRRRRNGLLAQTIHEESSESDLT